MTADAYAQWLRDPEKLRALLESDPAAFEQLEAITESEALIKEREICEGSLLEFFKRAWREIDPAELNVNWHHQVMCEYLEAIAYGEIRNLIINIPPRHTKTMLTSIIFPAWVWCRSEYLPLSGPHVKFLCVSYGAILAEEIALKMRRLVMGDWYQRLWGAKVQILEDQKSRANFANSSGGERLSNSIEGGILGRGGDITLVDDPQTRKGADSQAERAASLQGMSDLSTRITDPRVHANILIMQRLHMCLLPGTMVRTPNGETLIEKLGVGDTVLGSRGWQKILAAGSRQHSGKTVGVRLYGHPTTCWTTPDHRYLTPRGWVEAQYLKPLDSVAFPSGVLANTAPIPWEEPRMASVPRRPCGAFNGSRATSIPEEVLSPLVASGMTDTAIGRKLGFHRTMIMSYRWFYGLRRVRDRNPIFGADHLSDPAFWRIVGYWLAEGCFMRGRKVHCGIRFTFHVSERAYVNEIREFFSRWSIAVNEKEVASSRALQVEVNCSQMARWLESHFGRGARNKTVPEFVVRLPDHLKREVLEGWLCGDGCERTTGGLRGWRAGTSASLALIHGMQRIALSLNIRAAVVAAGREREMQVGDYRGHAGPAWELRLPPPARREGSVRCKIDGGTTWYQIRSVDVSEYNGPVYDITTPSHDFVVGNATVHNSDATDWALKNWRNPVHLMFPARFDASFPCPADLRKRDGELLWPAVWTEEELSKIEQGLSALDGDLLSDYAISGQLQQMPVPRGGGIINPDDWQIWPEHTPRRDDMREMPDGTMFVPLPDTISHVIVCLDTALSERETADWNACVVWGVWHRPKLVNIVGHDDLVDDGEQPRAIMMGAWQMRGKLNADGVDRQGHPAGVVQRTIATARRFNADRIVIENKTRGLDVKNEIARQIGNDTFRLQLFEPGRHGDKVARLHSVQPLYNQKLVYAPAKCTMKRTQWGEEYVEVGEFAWVRTVFDQIAQVPKGAHDDLADAASMGLITLREEGYLALTKEYIEQQMRARLHRPRQEKIREAYGV